MDQKIINLLAWQKSRGFRFPVYRNSALPTSDNLEAHYFLGHSSFRCTCPLSKLQIEALPKKPLVLFFSVDLAGVDSCSDEWETLFSKIVTAMKLKRGDVFHLSCNKSPDDGLVAFLADIVRGIEPAVLVILGQESFNYFQHSASTNLREAREKIFQTPNFPNQRMLATRHPRDLVSQPVLKRDVWTDMQVVMREIGQEEPATI